MKIGKKMMAALVCICILLTGTIAYAATPLEEAKYILEEFFIETLSQEAKRASTIEELMDAIHDPYTTYMSPEVLRAFMEGLEQEFTGIGVTVEQAQEGILILSILEGSGAEAVGLQAGDIITEVDGRSVKGMDLSEALTYIKGEEGTQVSIRIKRNNEEFTVGVKRSVIQLPTVERQWLKGDIGYIRIYSFGSDTAEELSRYLKELESKDPVGYIIDLRSNGGGYVLTALKIAGYFIGDNIAMMTSGREGVDQYIAIPGDIQIDRPVLMLMDVFSASASEILGGALRDYDKALLVGTPTFGKGTMQTLFSLSNGGVLKVTTGYTYTPNGESFNHVGLQPDLGTGEEGDPYYAALLMMGGDAEHKASKEGYMAIQINGQLYDIDLEQACQDEYWESYRAIIADRLQKGMDILVGTSQGWKPFEHDGNIHRYYFPHHQELSLLKDIERDKVFTVTFSRSVNADAIEDKIYLIDSDTGERINCKVVESMGAVAKVTPGRLLDWGREYYLLMEKGIKAQDGGQLAHGVLCRAKVRE